MKEEQETRKTADQILDLRYRGRDRFTMGRCMVVTPYDTASIAIHKPEDGYFGGNNTHLVLLEISVGNEGSVRIRVIGRIEFDLPGEADTLLVRANRSRQILFPENIGHRLFRTHDNKRKKLEGW